MKNESGLCGCGCGLTPSKWTQTYNDKGVKKGDYKRFLPGHYQAMKHEPKLAKCHPERKAKARGLCASCYTTFLLDRNPEKKKRHGEMRSVNLRMQRRNFPEKVAAAQVERRLKHRYGMSLQEFNDKLKQQNGLCEICLEKPKERKNNANPYFVDHDHQSGLTRGLLCNRCNNAIGALEKPSKMIRDLLKYMLKYDPQNLKWKVFSYFLRLMDENEKSSPFMLMDPSYPYPQSTEKGSLPKPSSSGPLQQSLVPTKEG